VTILPIIILWVLQGCIKPEVSGGFGGTGGGGFGDGSGGPGGGSPVLANPVSVSATADSQTAITISWAPSNSATSGFKIAMAPGATAPADCSTSLDMGAATSYQYTGLTSFSPYSFRVCAYGSGGTDTSGVAVSATTHEAGANEISGLSATASAYNQIDLSWTGNGGTTAGYIVTRAIGSAPANCSSGTALDVGTSTTYNDTGLAQNTNYHYRVCAYNSTGLNTTGLTEDDTTPFQPAA